MNYGNQMEGEFARGNDAAEQDDEYFKKFDSEFRKKNDISKQDPQDIKTVRNKIFMHDLEQDEDNNFSPLDKANHLAERHQKIL